MITYSFDQALELANFWMGVYHVDKDVLVEPIENYLRIGQEKISIGYPDIPTKGKSILQAYGIPLDTGWLPCLPVRSLPYGQPEES